MQSGMTLKDLAILKPQKDDTMSVSSYGNESQNEAKSVNSDKSKGNNNKKKDASDNNNNNNNNMQTLNEFTPMDARQISQQSQQSQPDSATGDKPQETFLQPSAKTPNSEKALSPNSSGSNLLVICHLFFYFIFVFFGLQFYFFFAFVFV